MALTKTEDLTGRTFGYLTVTGPAPWTQRTRWWFVVCKCGSELKVRHRSLHVGQETRSCGCHMQGRQALQLARAAPIKQERYRKGLCLRCGQKSANTHCDACREKHRINARARRAKRREDNQCISCDLPIVASRCCFSHWVGRIGVHALGTTKYATALIEAWETQKGLCAYTREKLIPGVNASLDHIVPRAKGGSCTVNNIQWVTYNVNRMKTDMTHEEFLAMCRLISDRSKHE